MEHIKVQINHNKGMLVIHGERPLSGNTTNNNNNKWTRFHKAIKLSEDSNPSEIRAKFSDGVLSIQVPKQVKEHVNDVILGEHSHHRRDHSGGWKIVNMNNWGATKAAVVLAMAALTVVVMIGAKSTPATSTVVANKEDIGVMNRAVKEANNQPKPAGFNFRF